ncbi:unnamed protein product [Protopolystoma xenopodis]|uniref:Uncharacterized protein n=1 Tax=Protopolystoma xenopodis TaxID=117903 RepID=A0A3S5BN29_9PLAT|nr:unnamed protein product [Protopolystoma xenopodis]
MYLMSHDLNSPTGRTQLGHDHSGLKGQDAAREYCVHQEVVLEAEWCGNEVVTRPGMDIHTIIQTSPGAHFIKRLQVASVLPC